jgi:hypothetical protein
MSVLSLGGISLLVAAAPTDDVGAIQETDANDTSAIRSVSYGGLAVVRYDGNTTYLFEEEPHSVDVTVAPEEGDNWTAVCLEIRSGTGEEVCSSREGLSNASVQTARIDFEEWPENRTGEMNVTVTLIAESAADDAIVDQTNASVHVLAHDEDISASGLTNAEEFTYGTDFQSADTDRDGLSDGEEVNTYGTDPLARDTAGNGIPDGVEVLLGVDPTNPWTPHGFLLAFALLFGVGFAAIGLRLTSDGGSPFDVVGGEQPSEDGVAEPAGSEESPQEDATDPILTDEQRVLQLLERHNGRARQKDIVMETDWSKSKVSRVLSGMEEAGTVSRTRIGRENIVTHEDADIYEGAERD